jgi:hypothetical protein
MNRQVLACKHVLSVGRFWIVHAAQFPELSVSRNINLGYLFPVRVVGRQAASCKWASSAASGLCMVHSFQSYLFSAISISVICFLFASLATKRLHVHKFPMLPILGKVWAPSN